MMKVFAQLFSKSAYPKNFLSKLFSKKVGKVWDRVPQRKVFVQAFFQKSWQGVGQSPTKKKLLQRVPKSTYLKFLDNFVMKPIIMRIQ